MLAVAALAFVTVSLAFAQPASQAPEPTGRPAAYQRLLDQYQRGQHEAAVKALLELDRRSIRVVEAMLELNRQPSAAANQARLRIAAMLHLDAAELLLTNLSREDASRHITTARQWADLSEGPAEPAGSFRRRWYLSAGLMMVQRGLAAGSIEGALVFFDDACSRIKDDVPLLTVAAWLNEQAALAPVPLGRGRSANLRGVREKVRLLVVADAFLKRALAVAPSDAEAGLRRGRILILLNDLPGAKRILSEVVSLSNLQRGEAYVARLLLARVAERASDRSDALRLYEEAIAILPRVSAARLGVAQLRSQMADAAAASAQIETLIAEDEQHIDPWQMYLIGHLVTATRDRSALRAEVQR